MIIGFFPVLKLPFGGSVTIGKILPLVFFTYFYGLKSGVLAGLTYGILKIIISFSIPPVQTASFFIFVILLDYIIPYSIIGLTAIFKNAFYNVKKYFTYSIIFSYFFHFLFSATSGVLIWGEYIPKEYNVWIYSAVYNLIYILPEMLISLMVCRVLLNFFILKNTNHTL